MRSGWLEEAIEGYGPQAAAKRNQELRQQLVFDGMQGESESRGSERFKIASEAREHPRCLFVSVGWHRDIDLLCPDVDCQCCWVWLPSTIRTRN